MKKEIKHFGILGMHWGKRKNAEGSISNQTISLAKKDAQRFVDAKMFYGQSAGTKRKLLKAELDKKRKQIPDYDKAFDEAVKNIDTAKSAQKAVLKRTTIDTTTNAKRLVKNLLNVTGPLTIAAAGLLYRANQQKVDAFVVTQFNNIVNKIKN